jgi:BA14K-like protein
MRLKSLALVALLLGSTAIIGTKTTTAAPLNAGSSVAVAAGQQQSLVVQVQRRRGGRGVRGGRRGGRGIGPGGAAAIGIIGAIGTMIAIDAANKRAAAADDAVAYCMRRFRSYDPESGTYVGHDGYRHPCP